MAVLGHAELALDDLSPMSPARERIREIETAARRAAELCRQMLAYSGKATLAHEPVNLRELVEEMVHLLKTSITKRAVLNLHLASDLPVIQADPSQLRQVVMNLIINASDSLGDHDGVIAISAGAIQCDAEYLRATYLDSNLQPGLYVYLEVKDTGCGMNPETLGRVFEPFFTTKFAGRGLGLAAVLGIVRSHKGAVRVYSEPGKGTSFKILFPAGEAEKTATSGKPSSDPDQWRGQGTILFVDDEPILRSLGARMLKQIGFNVLVASDGREAVDIYTLRAPEIDLVLMDLTMPRMDGIEAFDELRRLNPKVKVILASGFSEEDVAARFAGKGLVAVLQKPYRLSLLRRQLATALGDTP
jgi:CheY-like chemotaxis protein